MGFHKNLTGDDLHAPTNVVVQNDTGTTIPALTVLKCVGMNGEIFIVEPISALSDNVFAVAKEDIPLSGGTGNAVEIGAITGIDTSAWVVGTILYSDASGSLTATDTGLEVGTVIVSDLLLGAILVHPRLRGEAGTPGAAGIVGIVRTTPTGSFTHASIVAAMAAASAGDTIFLGPGTYAESFTIPDGVTLIGEGWGFNTVIAGSAPTGTRITIVGTSRVEGLAIVLPTDASYGIDCLTAGNASVESVTFVGVGSAATSVHLNAATPFNAMTMREVTHSGNANRFLHHEQGIGIWLEILIASGTFTSGVVLSETGANTIMTDTQIGDFVITPVGLEVRDSILDLVDVNIRAGDVGVYINDDAAEVVFRGVNFFPALTTHILVDPSLTTGNFRSFGGQVSQGKISAPLTWWGAADVGYFLFDERFNTNDKTLRVLDEFVVGHPYKPGKVNLGGGDNYAIGMAVYENTNLEIGTWSDVTTEAFSITGSTFNVFPGTAAGNAVYIGGEVPFKGMKVVTTTAIVLGAGAIAWEYWNGAAWVDLRIMCSQIVPPLDQYGNTLFQRVQGEHAHFGDLTGWVPKALNGTTKYWVRCRISTAITTVPALEEFKLLPDRVKFGLAGEQAMFGAARVIRNLAWSLPNLQPIAGATPGNQTISFSTNIALAFTSNLFVNNAVDARGGVITIPFGLDTSIDLELDVEWVPLTTAAGDVELEIEWAFFDVGTTLNGTLPTTTKSVVTTGPFTANVLQESIYTIPVSTLTPGSRVVLRIFRDAGAGNLEDTYAANIALVSTALRGAFWR